MDSRLATHAALADEHRLAIADALALADLTPSALAEHLSLSSNLLAHHLGVLADASVITRRRSEGDRRRSYVSLRWDNPVVAASVTPALVPPTPRVVFVCTQNSARSQFAASLFASQSDLPVASAGTNPATAIHPGALATLHDHGLAPTMDRPQAWDTVVTDSDFIVAVCDNAFENMPAFPATPLHWSIPDPATGGTPTNFAEAFSAIEPRVKRLAASLTTGAHHD